MTDFAFVSFFFFAGYKINVIPSGASSLSAFLQLLTGLLATHSLFLSSPSPPWC